MLFHVEVADARGQEGVPPNVVRTYRLILDKENHFFVWGIFVKYPDGTYFPVYMDFEVSMQDRRTDSNTLRNSRSARLHWVVQVPHWAERQALNPTKWRADQPSTRKEQQERDRRMSSQESQGYGWQHQESQASQGSQGHGWDNWESQAMRRSQGQCWDDWTSQGRGWNQDSHGASGSGGSPGEQWP